ncbi:hypothetical protein C1H46_038687 [Malus baccata]|uniref:Uncharacterized protein n=1 Tax=Malus baccata TaxID=106549 RepID=A0A540KNL5_MALBA|nr:hypothetical protein C1H46_038687 [Malus baccata]
MTNHIHLTNLMYEISPIRKITKVVEIIWGNLGLCTTPPNDGERLEEKWVATMDETMAEVRRRKAGRVPIFFTLRARSSSPRRRQPLQPQPAQTSCSSTTGPWKISNSDS